MSICGVPSLVSFMLSCLVLPLLVAFLCSLVLIDPPKSAAARVRTSFRTHTCLQDSQYVVANQKQCPAPHVARHRVTLCRGDCGGVGMELREPLPALRYGIYTALRTPAKIVAMRASRHCNLQSRRLLTNKRDYSIGSCVTTAASMGGSERNYPLE